MIDFETNRRGVVLEYEPEFNGAAWVLQQLRVHKRVRISRAFSFLKSDLIKGPTSESDEADEPIFRFRFAVREKGYFRIPGRILGVKNDVLIADEGITLDRKLFVAERNVGIFRRIAKVKQDSHEIIIGGGNTKKIKKRIQHSPHAACHKPFTN